MRSKRRHSSRVERVGEPIRRHDRLAPVVPQNPQHLLGAARLRGNRRALIFSHRKLWLRDREFIPRLDEGTDQRLVRLLILELQLHPFRRTHDLRNTHFIEIANEVVVVVPATKVQSRWRSEIERPAFPDVGAVEHAINVELCFPFAIGVDDVRPIAHRNAAGPIDVATREVAIHLNVRRTAILHDDLALPLLVAPGNQRRVRSFGTEPNLGAVRARAGRVVRNHVAAEDSLAVREMPRRADHALSRRRACVCAGQCARVVADRIIHVPDAEIPVRLVEHRLAIGLTGRAGIAPMQLDLLPRVPRDDRHAHPHTPDTLRGIPLFNLKCKLLAGARREPQVVSIGLRLSEVKEVAMQPHEHGELLDLRIGRQVRTVRCREQPDRTRMPPVAILIADGDRRTFDALRWSINDGICWKACVQVGKPHQPHSDQA